MVFADRGRGLVQEVAAGIRNARVNALNPCFCFPLCCQSLFYVKIISPMTATKVTNSCFLPTLKYGASTLWYKVTLLKFFLIFSEPEMIFWLFFSTFSLTFKTSVFNLRFAPDRDNDSTRGMILADYPVQTAV